MKTGNSSVHVGRMSKLLVLCIAGAAAVSLAVVLAGCSGGGVTDPRSSPAAGPQTQSAATAPSLPTEASGTQAGTAITVYASPT